MSSSHLDDTTRAVWGYIAFFFCSFFENVGAHSHRIGPLSGFFFSVHEAREQLRGFENVTTT